MNKTINGVIAIVVVGGLVFLAYKKFGKSKKRDAMLIIKQGKHGDYQTLMSFGDDYIEAWANAVRKKQDTFTLKGVRYNTQGGKLA